MSRILIADDDPSVLTAFEQALADYEYEVITVSSAAAVLARLEEMRPDVLVMDVRMPGMSGLEAFRRIRESHPRLPVIMMTGYGTMETAIEATQLGAFDYQLKPLNPEEMLHSIENALECVRLMASYVEVDTQEAPPGAGEIIVGQSRPMQEVFVAIGQVAATDASVLIRGETGTGKELVARAIYQHSRRAGAPLVVLNCAAIPETLLESELFGHEAGAFTGAEHRRIGKLEQASGGTVFLDEIGDMPLSTQAKLLRVLQEQSFQRLGGNQTIRVDLRLLAATNRNLEAALAAGRFREDLYHRLRVFSIEIPPLRQRVEDIPRLAEYFVARFAREMGIARPLLSREASEVLCRYQWPGNVRELENCLRRAIILTRGYPIQPDDIRRALGGAAIGAPAGEPASDPLRQLVLEYLQSHSGGDTHHEFLERVEKLVLTEALRLNQGNQSQTARWLGLARPTLKAKMDKYGLGGRGTTSPSAPSA